MAPQERLCCQGKQRRTSVGQRWGRILMLSDSLGMAQHLSPGEVVAEKRKAGHWHCFPAAAVWGWTVGAARVLGDPSQPGKPQ